VPDLYIGLTISDNKILIIDTSLDLFNITIGYGPRGFVVEVKEVDISQ
jgi:hypothetical protein